MPWNLFFLNIAILFFPVIHGAHCVPQTVIWWRVSHSTISFPLQVFCVSQRKGITIYPWVCIVQFRPFWKAKKCPDNTAWMKSFPVFFRYASFSCKSSLKKKIYVIDVLSSLQWKIQQETYIHIYIYKVTFQKSTFALFIPQLKKCSTVLVCFPFWTPTAVKINIPVGCTHRVALPLAISMAAFSPLLHLH